MKWFNAVQGYGFIIPDEGEELFVHHSKIIADGFRKLTAGERVSFEVDFGPKGPFAVEVRRSEGSASVEDRRHVDAGATKPDAGRSSVSRTL